MANQVDLTTLIQVLPHLSKVATGVSTHPESQRTVLFENALEHQEKMRGQVQKTEKSEEPKEVKREAPEQGGAMFTGERRKKEKEPEEEEETTSNASPWSGNILNVKI